MFMFRFSLLRLSYAMHWQLESQLRNLLSRSLHQNRQLRTQLHPQPRLSFGQKHFTLLQLLVQVQSAVFCVLPMGHGFSHMHVQAVVSTTIPEGQLFKGRLHTHWQGASFVSTSTKGAVHTRVHVCADYKFGRERG